MTETVLDIEYTIDEDKSKVRLVAVGIYEIGAAPKVFFIDHDDCVSYENYETIKQWALEYDGVLIGHHIQSDLLVLAFKGIVFPKATYRDTFTLLRCVNENETRFDLKTWSLYMGAGVYSRDFDEAVETNTVHQFPISKMIAYNSADLENTAALDKFLMPFCQQKHIFDLEMKILPLLVRMIKHGMMVNTEEITKQHRDYEVKIADIERKFYNKFGFVNFDSPKQMAGLLYDQLGIPIVDEENPRGTGEEVLVRMRHPAAELLLERRGLQKIVSSYLEPIQALMWQDGAVHGNFMLHGTETGRMTCRHPPMQTIPGDLRVIFKPRYGMFTWCDLDQLEFKIIADLAQEKHLVEAIADGEDVHSATARLLFGEVTPELRSIAKTVNYAVAYGAGVGKIMKTAKVNYRKAKEILENFKARFPKIIGLIDAVHQEVVQHKRVVSPFGRVRTFNVDFVSSDSIRACQREGFNFIVQSMGHDLLSLAWLDIDKSFSRLTNAEYANELHDELLMDHDPSLSSQVAEICRTSIDKIGDLCYDTFGYKFDLPITGTVKQGTVWS